MSESNMNDDEDTISVPLPKDEADEAPEVEVEVEAEVPDLEKMAFDLAGVCSALKSVGRTIAVLAVEFERLRKLVEGEEGEVTHAPPADETGLTPCCSRSVLDIPMTERISFDGAGITCKGVTG